MANWFRFWRPHRRDDNDFAAEIEAHLAIEADRLAVEGHTPTDAAAEARRRFGNVGRAQERFYEANRVMWVDDLRRDIHYAARTLAKDKAYVLTALAALGLGLAANIALFSLFSAIVLKSLPVPAPDQLLAVYRDSPSRTFGPFPVAEYLFYRDNARSFSNIAAGQPSHLRLSSVTSNTSTRTAAEPPSVAEPVIALFVTANYFDTFGIRAVVGRTLRPEDETRASEYSALISDNYWERRFGRDPRIIGSTLLVSGTRATIVGVSPRDFAGLRQEVPDLWISLAALGDLRRRAAQEASACCELIGRLANGASVQQARAELAQLASQRARSLPASERLTTVTVGPAVPFGRLANQIRALFIVLQVAMLLVLLVACGNVAGLLLGRAVPRQREIAIRLATGASRTRLVRQLVTEGVVLAVVAGIVAATVTMVGLRVAAQYGSDLLARQGGGTFALRVTPNARVLLYAAAVSLVAGVVFALAPALQASRTELVSALKSITGADGPRRGALRRWLVATQIALAVALLVTATGLARSAVAALRIDPGFRPHDVLTVWLTDPEELGLPAERARAIEAAVRDRLTALPGVEQLAVASRLPLGGNVTVSAMLPAEQAGDPVRGDAATRYPYTFISEGYLTTLAIPVRRGRMFTAQEVRTAAPVAIVSDSVAHALWPNGDAIGRQLALATVRDVSPNAAAPLNGSAEVIGIAGDVRGLALVFPGPGDVYLPRITNGWSSRVLLRVRGEAARVAREVPRIVHEVEPQLPVSVQPMEAVVATDFSVMAARVGAAIFALIGALGLCLALLGVYGMISYTVRQQRHEIGIRMALGAQSRHVMRSLLSGPMNWAGRGVIIGALLGIAGIKIASALLEGALVDARVVDVIPLLLVPLGIVAVVLLASFASARKAASVDPAAVLRSDG